MRRRAMMTKRLGGWAAGRARTHSIVVEAHSRCEAARRRCGFGEMDRWQESVLYGVRIEKLVDIGEEDEVAWEVLEKIFVECYAL